MEHNEGWERFAASGLVCDYLKYVEAAKRQGAQPQPPSPPQPKGA